jgi:ribosomal protein L40E
MDPLKEGAAVSEGPVTPAAPLAAASPAAPVTATPVAAILLCRRCFAELPTGATACPKCGEVLHQVMPRAEHRQDRPAPPLGAAAPVVPVVAVSVAAPPSLPGDVSQYYLPLAGPRPANAVTLVYHARLLGIADVAFLDKKRGLSHQQTYRLLAAVPVAGQPVSWHTAKRLSGPPDLAPAPGAAWGEVPESLNTAKKLKSLEKTLADFLYSSARLVLLENAKLGLIGQPGEDVVAFRERCRAAAVQQAEQAREVERAKYAPKFAALGARMPDAAVEGGFTLGVLNSLSWFGGKEQKPLPGDKIAKLEAEWHGKLAAIYEKCKQIGEDYSDVSMTPRRQDVQVTAFGLAWAPFWQVQAQPGRLEWVPAYR